MSEEESEVVEYVNNEIYKRWYKAGGAQGFLSVEFIGDIAKVSVDIGELAAGKLASHTKVYVQPFSFGSYLQAVATGQGTALYPGGGKSQPESFAYYGGGMVEGKPVSRVFRSGYWQGDTSAFAFVTEAYEANRSGTGAYIPITSKSISKNLLKVSRAEIAEISYRLNLVMAAWAAGSADFIQRMRPKKA